MKLSVLENHKKPPSQLGNCHENQNLKKKNLFCFQFSHLLYSLIISFNYKVLILFFCFQRNLLLSWIKVYKLSLIDSTELVS